MERGSTKGNENVYFVARKRAAMYNERLYSREGAAELLGISVSTLADYELGNTKVVPVDKVVLMADLYNAPELKTGYCKHECPICEKTIYAGIDVEISTGTEHFSLTEKDQLNLFGKKMQLLAGEEKLEYHEDGQPCKYFTAADMQKIVDRAMFYVSYNTTYCNAVNMWIKSAEKASDLEQIQWGAEIPEEFQNEVLKDYMKILASGGIS